MNPDRTTQGFYIFGPDGTLLRGWNNRDVPKMRTYLQQALKDYRPAKAPELKADPDPRFDRKPPEGGLIVDVFSKITQGNWPSSKNAWDKIFREATGRDHLWITKAEVEALADGRMPDALTRRIAQFHLVDNTRGEPPMWSESEVREAKIALIPEKGKLRLDGTVKLSTDSEDRGYEAKLFGYLQVRDGRVKAFDVVARGACWGEGTYTQGAPTGKFTLCVAFSVAATDEASKVAPQGARDLQDYIGR